MNPARGFWDANLPLIFFLYGLAFFATGLAIVLESHRPSELALARHLRWVAASSLSRSIVDWLNALLLLRLYSDPTIYVLQALRVGFLALSGLLLFPFGLNVLLEGPSRLNKVLRWGAAIPLALWSGIVLSSFLPPSASSASPWTLPEIWARYLLHGPGSVLAAWAFFVQGSKLRATGLARVAGDCLWNAAAFVANGLVTGLVVPAAPFFPASLLNDVSFQAMLGFPVQILRAGVALGIASFTVRLLQAFDLEQRQRAARELESLVEQRTRQLEERHRESAALSAIALTLSQPMPLQEMLTDALRQVTSILGIPRGGVILLRGEDEAGPSLAALVGLPADAPCRRARPPVGDCPFIQFILSGQPCFYENCPRLTARPCALPDLIHGHIILPLASRGETIGALCLYTPPDFRLDPAREQFLVNISRQIGVAMESARLAAEQRAQMQKMAILEERERISREMHDGLAQVLGFLCVKAESTLNLLRAGQEQEAIVALREIENVAQEAYVEVREAILGLRTTVAPGTGLIPSLTEYIHRFGHQFGIDVHLALPNGADIRLAPNAEVQLLRIVQEALTNVRKDAKARHAWVRFKLADGLVTVIIEDDGCGFDVTQVQGKHFGLETMRERAEAVGGSLELETAPGYGTRLTVRLPLGSTVVTSGGPHATDLRASG